MTKNQKIVIGVGIAAIVLMVLFPPYIGVILREGDNPKRFIGYSSFFSPPKASTIYEAVTGKPVPEYRKTSMLITSYIDSQRLTIQIAVCVLTIVGIVFIIGSTKEKLKQGA